MELGHSFKFLIYLRCPSFQLEVSDRWYIAILWDDNKLESEKVSTSWKLHPDASATVLKTYLDKSGLREIITVVFTVLT